MIGVGTLRIDEVDTEQERLIQRFNGLRRQHREFIVSIQPATFLTLIAMATCRVCWIEIKILGTLICIQISQHPNAWVGERVDDPLPHFRFPQSEIVANNSTLFCTETAIQPGGIVHDICQKFLRHWLINSLRD